MYAGGSINRHLPVNTQLISRMTIDAALYQLPPLQTAGRGRRRKKGARLSNPLQMAQDPQCSSIKTTVYLYGIRSRFGISPSTRYGITAPGQGCCVSLWSVIVSGRRRDDCFFSTGRTLKPPQILETFALRWPLEVCFRDVKQFLGLEDPQNRVSKATQQTAPLIFYL
ncbi:MAG: hypothetical protein ABSG62_15360 [Terracidiphilus sp.]